MYGRSGPPISPKPQPTPNMMSAPPMPRMSVGRRGPIGERKSRCTASVMPMTATRSQLTVACTSGICRKTTRSVGHRTATKAATNSAAPRPLR